MKPSTVAIALTAWVALTGWSAAVGQIRSRWQSRPKRVEPPWVETRKAEQLETVDGDGKLDLYFSTQAGSNALLRNKGGRFEKLPGSGNLALASQIGVTASFADIDNDGDPDLYTTTTVRGGNVLLE